MVTRSMACASTSRVTPSKGLPGGPVPVTTSFTAWKWKSPREDACELDWDLLKGGDIETRLSILTAWVITADHRQLSYSLKLPGTLIPVGKGDGHRSRCLESLALYLL